MGYLNYTFRSVVLGMDTKIAVTIPETFARPGTSLDEIYNKDRLYPTLYLCHGGGGDCTTWYRHTMVETYAQQAGMMTVSFDAEESFCCDMKHGRSYLTYACEELPRLIQALFPSSPKREDNFIAGYSMGGHCAMKIALTAPERFRAVMAGAGAKDQVKMVKLAKEVYGAVPSVHEDAFGPMDETMYGTANDLLYLAKSLKESGRPVPQLYMACGDQDYGYDLAYEYKQYLDEIGLPNEFITIPGMAHNYLTANEMIRIALQEKFTSGR